MEEVSPLDCEVWNFRLRGCGGCVQVRRCGGFVRETALEPRQLVAPIFVCEGEGVRRPIGSMPGVANLSIDEAVREVEQLAALGVGGVLLFGLPNAEEKDETGSGAYAADGITQRALRAMKRTNAAAELLLIADVCLCEVHVAWALRCGAAGERPEADPLRG